MQIGSASRWRERLNQLLAALGRLLELVSSQVQAFSSRYGAGREPRAGGKRWVRPEAQGEPAATAEVATVASEDSTPTAHEPDETGTAGEPAVLEVAGFEAIDTLLLEAGALKTEPEGDGAG